MAGPEDTGRSVMEEMMALFTPPGRETKTKPRKLELHPYYKRPGKGHNHDCCDACGEGGDLICCDSCPASFHFNCHAPPLEEDDIPMGDWICLRCYHREQMKVGIQSVTNVVSSASSKDVEHLNGTSTVVSDSSDSLEKSLADQKLNQKRGGKVVAKKPCDLPVKSERDKRVKIYRQKYDVYLKVKPLTNTPFDALIAAAQITNAQSFRLPRELECREVIPFSWKWADQRQDDQDTIRKFCYICGKSCRSRGIPALNCDFCSLVFHLDCLDPPLCEIPKERWMCPNHVENFLDANFVSSTRLSERIKIWQRYGRSSVDPDTVRLEFFRRVRFGKLYEASRARKLKLPPKQRIPVPGSIKKVYTRRADDFPVENSSCVVETQPPGYMGADQMDWLNAVALMKESAFSHSEEDQDDLKSERYKQKVKRVWKEDRQRDHDVRAKRVKMVHHNGDCESDTESISTASECSLNDSDEELLLSRRCRNEIDKYIAIYDKADDLSMLHPRVIKLLALQKMKEMFPLRAKQPNIDSQVRSRAALIPLNNRAGLPPFHMTYRVLEIGRGGEPRYMDLDKFGHCDFVSKRHARIFFDQGSRVFELINYSKHGTVVDSMIYTGEENELEEKSRSDLEMASTPCNKFCKCSSSPAEQAGLGCGLGAIVQHGSYLRFGCLEFVFCIAEDNDQMNPESTSKPVKVEVEPDLQEPRVESETELPLIESGSKLVEELKDNLNGEMNTNGSLQDDRGSGSPCAQSLDDQKDKEYSELVDSPDHDICYNKADTLPVTNQSIPILEDLTDISVSIDNSFTNEAHPPDTEQAENPAELLDVSNESDQSTSQMEKEVSPEQSDEPIDVNLRSELKEKTDDGPDEELQVDDEEMGLEESDHEQEQLGKISDNEVQQMEVEPSRQSEPDQETSVVTPPSEDLPNVSEDCPQIAPNDCSDSSSPDILTEESNFQPTENLTDQSDPAVTVESTHDLRHQASESQDIYIEIPQPSFTDGFPEDIFED